MPRITLGQFPRIAVLVLAACLGLGIAAGASADTPPGRGPGGGPAPTPPAGDCAVLRVQLNGTRPAAHTCAAAAPAEQGTALPSPEQAITSFYCYPGDVHLYEHTNYGGKRLCFYGEGSVNLSDFSRITAWYPFYWDWNDKVSSFATGQYFVTFYEHKNAGGAKFSAVPNVSRSYMWLGWNDRVSSLCIPGPTWSCP